MIEIGYTDSTVVWIKDEVHMFGINLLIDGPDAERWVKYSRRFGRRYADDILKDVITAGLNALGGLASYDEANEKEGKQ